MTGSDGEHTREQALLEALLQQWGAPAAQAPVMAAQLIKRAHQRAQERGSTPEVELSALLRSIREAWRKEGQRGV